VILYPAIDIRGGRAVRLMQGDYDRETKYDADPLDAARRWADGGAEWLHVVDLDGAKEGTQANLDHVRRIAAETAVPVQMGGGLRDADAVAAAFDAGVQRVVIGTAAVRDPEFLAAMLEAHGDRVVVGVDAKAGLAALEGWVETSDEPAVDLISSLAAAGADRFVFTPIEVDGTMEGPPLEQVRAVADGLNANLIYSGGIGSLEHLQALSSAGISAVDGVIVGRALYEERFSVAEAKTALALG
jgi:phosphoribosylformimino-5-aminoimidazole carboxamide ribotide isomerase